jgi:hypothetical protein
VHLLLDIRVSLKALFVQFVELSEALESPDDLTGNEHIFLFGVSAHIVDEYVK